LGVGRSVCRSATGLDGHEVGGCYLTWYQEGARNLTPRARRSEADHPSVALVTSLPGRLARMVKPG